MLGYYKLVASAISSKHLQNPYLQNKMRSTCFPNSKTYARNLPKIPNPKFQKTGIPDSSVLNPGCVALVQCSLLFDFGVYIYRERNIKNNVKIILILISNYNLNRNMLFSMNGGPQHRLYHTMLLLTETPKMEGFMFGRSQILGSFITRPHPLLAPLNWP